MPSEDLELMSLRICGTLTMVEAAIMPIPRPLEMASLMQSVEERSMSRRRVL